MLFALGAYTRTVTLPSALTSGEMNLGFGLFRAARQRVLHPSSAPTGFPCAKTSDAHASAKVESTTTHKAFIALLRRIIGETIASRWAVNSLPQCELRGIDIPVQVCSDVIPVGFFRKGPVAAFPPAPLASPARANIRARVFVVHLLVHRAQA